MLRQELGTEPDQLIDHNGCRKRHSHIKKNAGIGRGTEAKGKNERQKQDSRMKIAQK